MLNKCSMSPGEGDKKVLHKRQESVHNQNGRRRGDIIECSQYFRSKQNCMTSPPNRCEAATMPSETKDIDDVVTASTYQPAVSNHLKKVIMQY